MTFVFHSLKQLSRVATELHEKYRLNLTQSKKFNQKKKKKIRLSNPLSNASVKIMDYP